MSEINFAVCRYGDHPALDSAGEPCLCWAYTPARIAADRKRSIARARKNIRQSVRLGRMTPEQGEEKIAALYRD